MSAPSAPVPTDPRHAAHDAATEAERARGAALVDAAALLRAQGYTVAAGPGEQRPAHAPTPPTAPAATPSGAVLDDAQRAQVRQLAAGRAVAGGAPSVDVDVDAVVARQLTRAQLATMSHREVVAADAEGRTLGLRTPALAAAFTPAAGTDASSTAVPAGQLTRDDLRGMAPADVLAARAAGRLDAIMGPR